MKKKIFSVLTILTVCLHVSFAQSWSAPVLEASDIYNGSVYYVQNTGYNMSITAGGWWNTQAILKETGMPVTVRVDAATSLYVLEFSSGNTLFRDEPDNGGVYTDNTKDNKWNIQVKNVENKTYTIQAPSTYTGYKANQFLGATDAMESTNNGNAYTVRYNRDENTYSRYIEWKFLNITLYEARQKLYASLNNSIGTTMDVSSYENIYKNITDPDQISKAATDLNAVVFEYKTGMASPENPVDLTFLIANPGFEENKGDRQQEIPGWTKTGPANNEFCTRNDAGPNSGAFKTGTVYFQYWSTTKPDFSISQTIANLPKGKYTLKADAGVGGTGLYLYANDQQVQIATGTKTYSIPVLLTTTGSLTIGFKSISRSDTWAYADNFRLEYEGFDINSMVVLVNEQMAVAQQLLNEKMQNPVRAELNAAITKGQQATNVIPLVEEDLNEANSQLKNAINGANISVTAYNALQKAIDAAVLIYDENANEASVFQSVISEAQALVANFDASLDDVNNGTAKMNTAVFVFRLANPTGTVPTVVTNPNYARGATAAFGRMTVSGVTTANILEQGFCWSTYPEPTVLDSRSTKYYTNNGNIYHIQNLKPSTVYYMRAYVITKNYAVGYGNVIKVITIPKGTVTYGFDGSATGSGENYPRISAAVSSAVDYFNNFTSIQGHRLTVYYSSGTPTAEASYGGYMKFGPSSSYQQTGTALHEMGHTIGVGQHTYWTNTTGSPLRNSSNWLGERANKVVQFFDNNNTAVLKGDATHMWPYGINGAQEDNGTEILYIANSLIHQALGEDGLPPTSSVYVATPAYTFVHNDGEKYYLKNEDESRGRNTSFLVENATGNLIWQEMIGEAALNNDSAAWYLEFNPVNALYRIKNAATGKYFTYKSTGTNGIGLVSKATPASTENFQLLGARATTKIGSGTTAFTTKGYWIVRSQSSPLSLTANANGVTAASSFNIAATATTQRWLLLSESDVKLFDLAIPPTEIALPEVVSGIKIYTDKEQKITIVNIPEPSDVAIYDVSGKQISFTSNVLDTYSQTLSQGVFIVSISSKQYKNRTKVAVW